MTTPPQISPPPIHRGYIEGYYGRLLSWPERRHLINHLAKYHCDSYLYAPKEDPYHRYSWRTPYQRHWLKDFVECCQHAKQNNIAILAGIAPGLDFNFIDPEDDFAHLITKATQLIEAGADALVLMFDDISDDISALEQAGLDEGQLHGELANRLAGQLGWPVLLVPRLYADEIEGDHRRYAISLSDHLDQKIPVFICGTHIVAREVALDGAAGILAARLKQKVIIWDNFYCHDYCPRRLFLGPWTRRRDADPLLINGTGLIHTDSLLLGLMSGASRRDLFSAAGVPEAFWVIAEFFDKPVFTAHIPKDNLPKTNIIEAIDDLLWSWKSPLAREWYPYLFGLKHDLLIQTGQMTQERIAKTQTLPLFNHLRDR